MDFENFNRSVSGHTSEEGVAARFYDRTIKTDKIDMQGFPVFEEVCFCEIRLKDNVSEIFDQPATADKKARFPQEYAHYQQMRKKAAVGTPLEQFAFLSQPEIEALKVRGIFSVEELSTLEDDKANSLGVLKERNQARQFKERALGNLNAEKWRQKEETYQARIRKLEEDIRFLQETKRVNNSYKGERR